MTKKTLIILVSLVVLVLFFRSCGDDEEKPVADKLDVLTEEKTDKAAEKKTDGLVVLETDLAQGKISEEQAFVYHVLSVFNSAKCPKKYRTRIITYQGTYLINEVDRRWESFSPEAKEQLEPYYVSPLDPKSFLNEVEEGDTDIDSWIFEPAAAEAKVKRLPLTPAVYASSRKNFISKNGKVRIWYVEAEKEYAKILLEAFDKDSLYEKETDLMGFEPIPSKEIKGDLLDVFICKRFKEGGITSGKSVGTKRKYPVWIAINGEFHKVRYPKKYKEYIKSSMAHELFHGIQFAIDHSTLSEYWWKEATAVWAESFFYPNVDFEHRFKSLLFKDYWLAKSLTHFGVKKKTDPYYLHAYAAYVFPYYMTQRQGGPEIIANIWKAMEPMDKAFLDVVEAQMNMSFEDILMEFARWMYNEKPEKHLMEGADYFTNLTPVKDGLLVSLGKNYPQRRDLEYLGITYEVYDFTDEFSDLKSADFDFTDLLGNYPDVKVWAMVKQKGQDTESQDWRNVMFKNFCFDIPEEDLEKVVLIYANCSKTKTVPASQMLAEVTAYEEGCAAKVDLTVSMNAAGDTDIAPSKQAANFFFNMEVKRAESGQATVAFREVLKDEEFPKLGKKLIPFGHFSFKAEEESGGSTGFGNLRQFSQSTSLSGSGQGTWDGKHATKNGFGTISLKIYWPKEEPNLVEEVKKVEKDMQEMSTEEQIAQFMPAEIQGLFNQATGMQQKMGGVNTLTDEIKKTRPKPKEGQIAYLLTMNVHGIPATEVKTGEKAGSKKTTMDMNTPVSIYRVVDVKGGSYSFQENGEYPGGTFNVAGTIRINKTLRERKSKEDTE